MHEGAPAEEVQPTWDPNSGVPPPMTPEYGFPFPLAQATETWDPNSGVPPPFTLEHGAPGPMWPGQESGLPPPLTPEFGVPAEPSWAGKELGLPPPFLPEYNVPIGDPPQLSEYGSESAKEASETNEAVKEIPNVPILGRELMRVGAVPEQRAEYMQQLQLLPPDAIIDLYHGVNGGLASALAVIESEDQGVRQFDTPTLAVYPVGQFWKPGDAGLKYGVPRNLVSFSGEENPNAKFKVDKEGAVSLVGMQTVPVTKYNGQIMRTVRTEEVLQRKLVGDEWQEQEMEMPVELTPEERAAEVRIAERMTELREAEQMEKKAQEEMQIDSLRASIMAKLSDQ